MIDIPTGPLRSDKSYEDDLKQRISKNGVLGLCCLSYLDHYHPISGTCIDYMHSVLEGVVKGMFYRWFGVENHQMECSLKSFMHQIDGRIICIKPPKFVPTTPRSIYSWKQWRAHEYLSFILYYSLPVFIDIMEASKLEHLLAKNLSKCLV